MAKFIPKEFVEILEYDFTEYGGSEGVITEPTTGKVNAFFKNMKNMVKEVSALQKTVKDLGDEELTDEELTARIATMDEAESTASEYQTRTVEYLAELCGAERVPNPDWEAKGLPPYEIVGGSPSLADLQTLPFRVMQAFSTWLMGEIKPKKTTPGMKG